jgi:hypothetical protein
LLGPTAALRVPAIRGLSALFKRIGALAEIFEADAACGLCGSANLRPGARKIDQIDYVFLHCNDCGGELAYGTRRDGSAVFPKRSDADGHALAHGGWKRWQPSRAIEAASAEPQSKE